PAPVAVRLAATHRQIGGDDAIDQRIGPEKRDQHDQGNVGHHQGKNAKDNCHETTQPHRPPVSRKQRSHETCSFARPPNAMPLARHYDAAAWCKCTPMRQPAIVCSTARVRFVPAPEPLLSIPRRVTPTCTSPASARSDRSRRGTWVSRTTATAAGTPRG